MAGTDTGGWALAAAAGRDAVADMPPLVTWPGMRHLAHASLLAAGQMAWFLLVYGGANWITAHRSTRFAMHLEIERQMPFVPAAIVLYMSIYLLFGAAPFVLRTRREMNAIWLTFSGVTLIAGICFLAFPADLAYHVEREWGAWAPWYAIADRMNLRYNLAPSLHVALSIVCVDFYAARAGLMGKALLWLWGAGIALSTLLTHEHHMLDVITGFALALAATRIGIGRGSAPAIAPGSACLDSSNPNRTLARRG